MEPLKKMAGEAAASLVTDGMTVGLGTGSTVKYTILKLGERVKEGLDIVAIPTSVATEKLAKSVGIDIISPEECDTIDITIDGADEVDPDLDLIKGHGGALFREKVVAKLSKRLVIVVDEAKLVTKLGKKQLPVEVVPFSYRYCAGELQKLGCTPTLRKKNEKIYVTDNGNYILDCKFAEIHPKDKIEHEIKRITGVVECGLFIGLVDTVYVGTKTGLQIKEKVKNI